MSCSSRCRPLKERLHKPAVYYNSCRRWEGKRSEDLARWYCCSKTQGTAKDIPLTDSNEGLAGVHIHELDIGHQRHALLVVGHIRTYVLAEDVERADLTLWVENRTRRAVEDNRLVGLSRGRVDVALVISPQHTDGASLVESVALAEGSWRYRRLSAGMFSSIT